MPPPVATLFRLGLIVLLFRRDIQEDLTHRELLLRRAWGTIRQLEKVPLVTANVSC
jgi:hypothetical protein